MRDVPAVRILPMSGHVEGFRGRTIAQVQTTWFLRRIPAGGGRWRYPSTGLAAAPGTVVLFQFQARIIASAVFLQDEKFPTPRARCRGVLHFQPDSFRTFQPLDAEAMRHAWPGFRGFGHAKQRLNPLRYPAFLRQLKAVAAPARRSRVKAR